MDDCFKILDESYARASKHLEKPFIADAGMQAKIEAVALCLKNRAGVRALLAGLLAKLHTPSVDIRKPFTDITGQTGDDNFPAGTMTNATSSASWKSRIVFPSMPPRLF